MTDFPKPNPPDSADEYGTLRGSGVCSTCGGLGVLRDKPWKEYRETMSCHACDGSPISKLGDPDPDRLAPPLERTMTRPPTPTDMPSIPACPRCGSEEGFAIAVDAQTAQMQGWLCKSCDAFVSDPRELAALQPPGFYGADPMPVAIEHDSRPDTYAHIADVRGLLLAVAHDLIDRAHVHDASKLVEPELSMFNEYRRRLDTVEHASPEYRALIDEMMEKSLEHHYRHNAHHPEHHDGGVHGMSLIDLIEMLCDWLAASRRHGNHIAEYVKGRGRERFGYGDEIEGLMLNTLAFLNADAEEKKLVADMEHITGVSP